MARRIKKVKTGKKLGKKFWIIFSSVATVVVVGVVILCVWLATKDNTTTYNYFSDYAEYKVNYDNLDKIIENNEAEHILIFAYDGSAFDAKTSDSDDDYSKVDTEIEKYVIALIEAVNKRNTDEGLKVVSFYIINTALVGNSGFLTDTDYGGYSAAPCLIYVYGETFSEKTKDDKETIISGTNTTNTAGNSSLVQLLKVAKDYVNKLTV